MQYLITTGQLPGPIHAAHGPQTCHNHIHVTYVPHTKHAVCVTYMPLDTAYMLHTIYTQHNSPHM